MYAVKNDILKTNPMLGLEKLKSKTPTVSRPGQKLRWNSLSNIGQSEPKSD
jgi:hypothetical protein